MKSIKSISAAVLLIFGSSVAYRVGSHARPAYENEKTACNVLRRLAESSSNWSEVVAYRNAFNFVESRIGDKTGLSDDETYFKRLAERNRQTRVLVCMYLDKEPKRDCGFRHLEADNILEAVDEKMKKDHLSTDDILKAIERAQPQKDPRVFRP